jgi:hypothetical protein
MSRTDGASLVNSCQNKFGFFDQFTWQKQSEGNRSSLHSKKNSTLVIVKNF